MIYAFLTCETTPRSGSSRDAGLECYGDANEPQASGVATRGGGARTTRWAVKAPLGVLLLIGMAHAGSPGEDARAAESNGDKLSNTLRWSTASEVENFGYDLYRAQEREGAVRAPHQGAHSRCRHHRSALVLRVRGRHRRARCRLLLLRREHLDGQHETALHTCHPGQAEGEDRKHGRNGIRRRGPRPSTTSITRMTLDGPFSGVLDNVCRVVAWLVPDELRVGPGIRWSQCFAPTERVKTTRSPG